MGDLDVDARAAAVALFDLDPASVRCPHPAFTMLREQAPVVWFDQLDAFVVSGYDLIVEVLRHPDRFSSRYTTGPITDRQLGELMRELVAEDAELGAMLARRREYGTTRVLVRADPPVHGRQRGLVNRAFSPGAIRALEPGIEALAHGLIDGFIDHGTVELVGEFAVPLPMTVIADALGVSRDRRDDFRRWSDGIVGGIGQNDLDKEALTGIIRSRSELEAYLIEVIQAREVTPTDDLVSRIVHSRVDGERLSHHEIMDMIVQFLLAGNETTAKLITSTLLHLVREPALADRLRADPALVAPVVEEVLRLEPPSMGLYRTAVADEEVGGVSIPAGSALWLVFAAGNRDPERFEAPDECSAERSTTVPHLGFGLGAHFCLGAGLARAEGRIAVRALLERLDDITLEIPPEEVPYDPSYMVHGISRLPLSFTPRKPS
jgi:cytochrome P450